MDRQDRSNFCLELDKRRRHVRMSYAVLARRSGVSMPTLIRTLSGHNPHISFESLLSIAAALGMQLKLEPLISTSQFLESEAEKKARQIVGMVQGTSGLESQAVGDESRDDLIRQTVHELLAGSPRKLWEE